MPEVLRQDCLGVTAVIASPVMRELYRKAERIAASPASVLVTGESGTGKELVARVLHQMSPRASRPWVDISCASLPEHLVESELFGYEKGAFSGALNSKPGLFEMAHQGTIFLDEIGELEARMQTKLLRVLDGSPYYRLGGTRKITVDVRVIAATNRDLRAECAAGRFRLDLLHRLSQIEVKLPPLRQRREDIGALAEWFLTQQGQPVGLSPAAVRRLEQHDWPGNVRELRNVVTRAAVMAVSDCIEPHDLDLPAPMAVPVAMQANGFVARGNGFSLEQLERQTIFDALEQTRGHQGQAAALLGISMRTLSRKLKTYELEKSHVAQPV